MLPTVPDNIMAAVVAGSLVKLTSMVIVGCSHRKMFQKVGTVDSLYMYPVKSCGAVSLSQAQCTPVGLSSFGVSDRQWMILDEAGRVVTMKEEPRLTLVTCHSEGNDLVLRAPGLDDLHLDKRPDLQAPTLLQYRRCKEKITVVYCGQGAEQWISSYLRRPATLVFSCPELGVRDVYRRSRHWPNTARDGDVTIFAYLTSYLLTTTKSLDHVNSQVSGHVSSVNFRPNIVINNSEPFDEDNWAAVKIGHVTLFHAVEPCRRCLITTIEPTTAEFSEDRQPLALLKTFRCRQPYGAAPIFGLYVSLDVAGSIQVGDPVYVLRKES
ncbi:mitochondrial amidoxime-reducing component 1-like [Physella acuta]|uniref:mitochondrial amidoxime-reducing component 1-like n=1 Tax=Physella acuta TaxID=109671 RepID=UPI0027DC2148|nr:mitochondrial amidoxime-reducing component 1-like [Physella acuta]